MTLQRSYPSGAPTARAQQLRTTLLHWLLVYIVVHLFLRSFSNGVDLDYGTSLSSALSAAVIFVAAVAFALFGAGTPGRTPLVFLVLTAAIGAIGAVILELPDPGSAVRALGRYAALAGTVVILGATSRLPGFLPSVLWLCRCLLAAYALTAVAQYASGAAYFVEPTDPFARVRGFSAHPVSFSMEIVVIGMVAEVARLRLGRAATPVLFVLYGAAAGALLLAASRTGLLVLAIALALICARRSPWLIGVLTATGVAILLLTPLGRLFSDLQTLPGYLLEGRFTTWDYRYADSSFHWRVHHWYYLVREGLSSPWLGWGIGQTLALSPFNKEAHSFLVELFFEQGIPGVLTAMGFWSALFVVPFRSGPPTTTLRDPALARAREVWLALLVGFFLAGVAGSSINRDTVALSHLLLGFFALLAPGPEGSGESSSRWSRIPAGYSAGVPRGGATAGNATVYTDGGGWRSGTGGPMLPGARR